MCSQRRVWERLKQYEDTGFEPEEIGDMKTAYDENQIPYMIEATGSEAVHIHNFLLAESKGRLIELPCVVGDTVYRIYTRAWVGEDRVMSFVVLGKDHIAYEDDKHRMTNCAMFGKTVFLTREEAEAALKEDKQ